MLSVASLEAARGIVTALMAVAIPVIGIGAYRAAARKDYRPMAGEAALPRLQKISPFFLTITGLSLIAWGLFLMTWVMPHFSNLPSSYSNLSGLMWIVFGAVIAIGVAETIAGTVLFRRRQRGLSHTHS